MSKCDVQIPTSYNLIKLKYVNVSVMKYHDATDIPGSVLIVFWYNECWDTYDNINDNFH